MVVCIAENKFINLILNLIVNFTPKVHVERKVCIFDKILYKYLLINVLDCFLKMHIDKATQPGPGTPGVAARWRRGTVPRSFPNDLIMTQSFYHKLVDLKVKINSLATTFPLEVCL